MSGGIEAVILSKAIVDSKIPSINLDNPDPARLHRERGCTLEVDYAMSNSLGSVVTMLYRFLAILWRIGCTEE